MYKRQRPFFLYLGTNDIHVPRVPHERFAGRSGMGPRGDAVLSFDHTVGKVLDALDSLGLADNTLLIISSDNGPVVDDGYNDRAAELLGDHRPWGDFRGGKYSAFEAGTRVPFIVRWPGHVAANRISDALLSHIDPVSYTHLDVYKRQVRRNASCAGKALPSNRTAIRRDRRPGSGFPHGTPTVSEWS